LQTPRWSPREEEKMSQKEAKDTGGGEKEDKFRSKRG